MRDDELSRLIAEVDAAALGEQPLARLTAAADRRKDLAHMAEALLDHFVTEARAAGCSWAEIGDAIGVSKQAAQQRAAAPATVARGLVARLRPSTRTGGHGLFGRMSPLTRDTVVAARDAAQERQHHQFGTGHLLIGLLAVGDDVVAASLMATGTTVSDIRTALTRRLDAVVSEPTGDLRFAPDGRKAMELALRESIRLNSRQIEPGHLLLGLLGVGRGVGIEGLFDLQIDAGYLRAEVERRLTRARRS